MFMLFKTTLNIINNKSYNKVINYSNFIQDINNNYIKEIRIYNKNLYVFKKNNTQYIINIPYISWHLLYKLSQNNIPVYWIPKMTNWLWDILWSIIYWLYIILTIYYIFIKNINNSKNKIFSFMDSPQKFQYKKTNITFKNIAGCKEAKEEVNIIIQYLKNPKKFKKLGAQIPKGILMIGQPGTGKTLLAQAIAGEAKVPFLNISGSEFIEIFAGLGATRVRNMFLKAKEHSPCIIFIDEIDSIGKTRNNSWNNNDERDQTLNQILVEMDGFNKYQNIIILAATNRPDVLDPALLRAGRFDRQVIIDLPDISGRKEILKIHTLKKPLNKNVNLSIIAKSTTGFTGADLANLINEASLLAVQKKNNSISMEEFEAARDKIILGVEKKSVVLSKSQKKRTAYHESGHVIISLLINNNDILHKVTIIPRGRSLGNTLFLPKQDSYHINRQELENKICILYGGRIAEEIIYGKKNISIGSSHDIKQATLIARNMILKWGFSENIGPIWLENKTNNDSPYTPDNNHIISFSEYTNKKTDKEIHLIIKKNYLYTKNIMMKNIILLHYLQNKLMTYETLHYNQIQKIFIKYKEKKNIFT